MHSTSLTFADFYKKSCPPRPELTSEQFRQLQGDPQIQPDLNPVLELKTNSLGCFNRHLHWLLEPMREYGLVAKLFPIVHIWGLNIRPDQVWPKAYAQSPFLAKIGLEPFVLELPEYARTLGVEMLGPFARLIAIDHLCTVTDSDVTFFRWELAEAEPLRNFLR